MLAAETSHTRNSSWIPAAAVLLGIAWGANQFTPLLLVYSTRLDLSAGTLEALFGIYVLGVIPGLLLAGPWSDARGRRAVVVPTAVLSLLASVVLVAGTHHMALLFLGRLLAGVSSGAVFGAGSAWMRELSLPPFGTTGDHAAARRAAIAMTIGFGVGPLATGLLAQWAPAPTVVPYLPHIVLMAVVLLLLRDAPETVAAERAAGVQLSVPGIRDPRFVRLVAPMAPWVFLAPAVAFALLPSVVGAEHASDGIALTAAITALVAFSGIAVQPIARRLDAREGGHHATLAGLLVLVAGLALGALTADVGSTLLLIPCSLLLGSAYGLLLVAGLVKIQRIADPAALARLTAAYYTLTYVGLGSPYLFALGAHVATYSALLLGATALACVTALVVTRSPRQVLRPALARRR